MKQTDFLPVRDTGLQTFAANLANTVAVDPASWGVSPAASADLLSASDGFAAALAIAREVSTRTRVSVTRKNQARALLRRQVRSVAATLRAFSGITPERLALLGLKPPKRKLTPQNPPQTRPSARITRREPLVHELWIGDTGHFSRRARPDDAIGALIFASLAAPGEPPAGTLEDFRFCGIATRETFTIRYRPADAGKTAHIIARWFGRRGQLGPLSAPAVAAVAA